MPAATPVILRFPAGAPRLRVVRGDDGDARRGLRIFYGASTPLRRTASGRHVSARNKSGDPACSEAASAWRRKKATSETFTKLAECRAKAKAHGQAKLHRAAGDDLKAQVLEHRAETGKVGDTHRRQLAFQARNYRLGRQLSRAADRQPPETDPIERGRRVAMRRAENEERRAETPPTRTFKVRPHSPAHREAIDSVLSTFRARDNADDARRAHVEPGQVARVNALSDARYREAQAALKAFRREEGIGRPASKPAPKPAPAPAPAPATPPSFPEDFSDRLNKAASRVPPEGRFGDNKVFIGHLHRAYEGIFGPVPIAQFKRQLAEANNRRRISLARADMVEAMDPRSVAESETGHMGSTFHFVRTAPVRTPQPTYRFNPAPAPAPAAAASRIPLPGDAARDAARREIRRQRDELDRRRDAELARVPGRDIGGRRAIKARYAALDRPHLRDLTRLDREERREQLASPEYRRQQDLRARELMQHQGTYDPRTGGHYTGD